MSKYGVFFRFKSEYGKIRTRKNSVFGQFSRSDRYRFFIVRKLNYQIYCNVTCSCLTLSWRRSLPYWNHPSICSENHWIGFYMIWTSAMKELGNCRFGFTLLRLKNGVGLCSQVSFRISRAGFVITLSTLSLLFDWPLILLHCFHCFAPQKFSWCQWFCTWKTSNCCSFIINRSD